MVGPLLTLSFAVRALSIEAGWPRAPRDGFVRGGGPRLCSDQTPRQKIRQRRPHAGALSKGRTGLGGDRQHDRKSELWKRTFNARRQMLAEEYL